MALRQRASSDLAPEIAPYPELHPYAVAPAEVTCRHGCHAYVAREVARRQDQILFVDPRTEQFGIALADPSGGIEARQYPEARIAILMFLGAREALDAE